MNNLKKLIVAAFSVLMLLGVANAAEKVESPKKLTVILSNDALRSAGFGMAVANAMQDAGIPATVFLTGDALELGLKKGVQPKFGGSASPREMMEALLKKGGKVYVCVGCAKNQEVTESDLIKGIKIVGPAELVEGIYGDGAKTLTF